MDMFYREACHIQELEHALTITATIVSRPTPDRAVMDAGRKAIDVGIYQPRIISHRGVSVQWLSAEHGILKIEPNAEPLQVGELVELVPGYADLTNNLHQQFYAFRGDRLEETIRIEH